MSGLELSENGTPLPTPDEALPEPALPRLVRRSNQRVWIAALVAFLLGLGAGGWLGWRSGMDFGHILGLSSSGSDTGSDAQQPAAVSSPATSQDQMALIGRVAALEQRLDRLDVRVQSASGNAARAEALLVAFAVRRVVERGAPLGYLADQLKLRFGAAQPNAVATIITDSKDLVPLDQLAARLEALAPQLTASGQQTLWSRVTRELSEMFVVRRDRPISSDNDARFDDARIALSAGRIDDAIAIVKQLSNGNDASNWIAAARRYHDVQVALDLIDTTALLAPRQLHDAGGNTITMVGR